jgi:hypothetical protein
MARPWVPDRSASDAKRARRSSSACFEKALRESRGKGSDEIARDARPADCGGVKQAGGQQLPWRPFEGVVPGGRDEAGGGGGRGGAL